jgi:hypothetical protein
MTNLDEVERAIERRLNSLLKTRVAASARDRDWTIAVKKTLGDLGKERGYEVCASDSKKRFEPEWLFDLIWYIYDHDGHLQNIPLILEMEWALSFDEVKWDFEKLVTGRADHRILIFQAANSRAIEDYCRRLIRDIAVFEHSSRGDRYLFAGYDMKASLFNYWPFQF